MTTTECKILILSCDQLFNGDFGRVLLQIANNFLSSALKRYKTDDEQQSFD